MKKASDILISVLGNIHPEGEIYVSFFSSWEKIAGTDIANHSSLSDLKNGTLYIEVDHPGWIQIIQMKKREIMKKAGSMFPELNISDLRIFLGKSKKREDYKLQKSDNDRNNDERMFKELLERLRDKFEKDEELT